MLIVQRFFNLPMERYLERTGTMFANFSPLDLSPDAWYDASDKSTITLSSGAVSQWNDKSGNAKHVTQGTAANRPAFANDTITFDGADDYLSRAESVMFSSSQTSTVFFVCANNAGTFDRVLAEASTSAANPIYSLVSSDGTDATKLRTIIRNDAGTSAAATQASANFFESGVYKVYSVEDTITSINARVNGAVFGTNSYTRPSLPISLNVFSIGALVSTTVSTHSNVSMNEIIIYKKALTAKQKRTVERYLGQKWGIKVL